MHNSKPLARPIFVFLLSVTVVIALSVRGPQPEEQSEVDSQQIPYIRTVKPVFDVPALAFRTKATVDKVLGKPIRGPLPTLDRSPLSAAYLYRNAHVGFWRGRLVAIDYKFVKRPLTIDAALDALGLPRAAAQLQRSSVGGLLAADTPLPGNQMMPNPLRCCGLTFYNVVIPENLTSAFIVFGNTMHTFSRWPKSTQEAWMRAEHADPLKTSRPRLRQ
jgi:hypothetical protein